MSFFGENAWDEQVDGPTIRNIHDHILDQLPDHHHWQGCIFQFNDSNVSDVMEQLIWSGILDCTVPDSLYTIACKIQRRPFGMTTLRLVVGYIYDII
jgi:hypothetical protein